MMRSDVFPEKTNPCFLWPKGQQDSAQGFNRFQPWEACAIRRRALKAERALRRRRKRPQPRVERSGTLGTDMNRRPALKERQMLAVFFARALGWQSDRLDTRSPVYERLPLFRLCLASSYVQGNVVGADLRAARGG